MFNGGFEVDLDAMREAASGINRTLRDMEACEVEAICGPEEEYGHEGLWSAFGHFCDRWQYGVEVLIEDGEQMATALTDAVISYASAEEANIGGFTGGR